MPWTPTAAGQTLTSAKVEELASFAVAIQAEKASTSTRTSTITVSADSELVLVLPANRTYDVTTTLIVSGGNAAGDIRTSYSWTNTATVIQGGHGLVATLASGTSADAETLGSLLDTTTATSELVYGVSSNANTLVQWLRVTTGGSDVTLTLQWAQGTSSVSATSIHAGSKMVARRAN